MEYGFFECGCGPCGCIGVKKICKEDRCSIALKQGGWGLLRGWFLGLVGDCILVFWAWFNEVAQTLVK